MDSVDDRPILTPDFQMRIGKIWLGTVFQSAAPEAMDPIERALRFLEESQELAQSLGVTREQALQLVEYTWSRPVGEPPQEVGGSLVTLASLCDCVDIDMIQAGWTEFYRCHKPEVMEKIRNKQVTKQLHGIGGTPVNG